MIDVHNVVYDLRSFFVQSRLRICNSLLASLRLLLMIIVSIVRLHVDCARSSWLLRVSPVLLCHNFDVARFASRTSLRVILLSDETPNLFREHG
jgi:hypothetical protein